MELVSLSQSSSSSSASLLLTALDKNLVGTGDTELADAQTHVDTHSLDAVVVVDTHPEVECGTHPKVEDDTHPKAEIVVIRLCHIDPEGQRSEVSTPQLLAHLRVRQEPCL